jgi:hypothetical protein
MGHGGQASLGSLYNLAALWDVVRHFPPTLPLKSEPKTSHHATYVPPAGLAGDSDCLPSRRGVIFLASGPMAAALATALGGAGDEDTKLPLSSTQGRKGKVRLAGLSNGLQGSFCNKI